GTVLVKPESPRAFTGNASSLGDEQASPPRRGGDGRADGSRHGERRPRFWRTGSGARSSNMVRQNAAEGLIPVRGWDSVGFPATRRPDGGPGGATSRARPGDVRDDLGRGSRRWNSASLS